MTGLQINKIQNAFGSKIACDSYPYPVNDRDLWLTFISRVQTKSIGLYAELMKLRAIGCRLEKNVKFNYVLKPIIRGDNNIKWGYPSVEKWNEDKKALMPYMNLVIKILGELNEDK